ncbi:hypothetical protein [Chitinophaga sp. CF118]|nr:hypothetical protein [Chitinophaga sp. CF118]
MKSVAGMVAKQGTMERVLSRSKTFSMRTLLLQCSINQMDNKQ